MNSEAKKVLSALTLFEKAVEEWLMEEMGYNELDATRLIGKFYSRARQMGRENKSELIKATERFTEQEPPGTHSSYLGDAID